MQIQEVRLVLKSSVLPKMCHRGFLYDSGNAAAMKSWKTTQSAAAPSTPSHGNLPGPTVQSTFQEAV